MSITDELREWWVRKFPIMDKELNKDFIAIADRIDAEHERQLGVLYRDMSDAEWVRLPKDADGEYIRIGDVMEWVPYDDTYQTVVRKVVAVGADVFFAWSDEKQGYAQYEACAYRHHHAPTVEDVLREFAYGLGVPVADSYIAASAAKLRLAEGVDE